MNDNVTTQVLWVEKDESQSFENSGTRVIGVHYEDINLSELTQEVEHWDERGMEVTTETDITKFLAQPITTRDEAARIANRIFELIQNEGKYKNFE